MTAPREQASIDRWEAWHSSILVADAYEAAPPWKYRPPLFPTPNEPIEVVMWRANYDEDRHGRGGADMRWRSEVRDA